MRLLAVPLALALLVGACASPDQQRVQDLVNQKRSSLHVRQLAWNDSIGTKAQNWSARMAAAGALSHSDLRAGAPTGWRKLGENVGVGYSVEAVEKAFIASPKHFANIKDPDFNYIGTGVTRTRDGRVWVVQVFMQR